MTGTPVETCPVTKSGTDDYVGDYYSAPCGWSTYNRGDLSHWKWHQRELGHVPEGEGDD